jgi:hypothetical protein
MNWGEYIERAEGINEESPLELDEKLVRKDMVRDGKKVKRWITTKPGWKVEYDKGHNPREVKISATEKKNRKLAQKKAKLKRQAEMKLLQQRRLKSFRKRDRIGLDYDKDHPATVTAREEGKTVPSDIRGALRAKLDKMKETLRDRIR